MNLIACVSKNWCLGKDNKLLFNIKEDLKQFKEKTLNKVVVMGYNTYKSIPNNYLPDRVNIVLTHSHIEDDKIVQVHNIDELFKELYSRGTDNVFIIGGATLYNKLIKYCDTAYITYVNKEVEGDVYLNNLDNDKNWAKNGVSYLTDDAQLIIYKNKKVKRYIPKDYLYKVKTTTTLYLDNDENNWENEIPQQYCDMIKKGSILYIYKVIENGESHYEAWNSNYEPKIIWQAGDEFILDNNKDWIKEVK